MFRRRLTGLARQLFKGSRGETEAWMVRLFRRREETDLQKFLAPVSASQIGIHNVTFEPGCQNNWHIHHAKSGGGQILICVGGRGWYQEWGKEPVAMKPGDCVNIPASVKHWHGAAEDSWFSHLAIEVPGEETSTEWLEASK